MSNRHHANGNGNGTPQTVDAYLAQLKRAMTGCPPAVIRDALSDAEEHLRNELAQDPNKNEAEVMASVIENYGTPQEIAEEYRAMERTLAGPFARPDEETEAPPRRYGFFGVVGDPRAYGALIYMLLSLATGIFYFTWVVAWGSLSIGTLILIFGFIIALFFIGSVRLLSLVEGRIVEGLLGVRMPRRLPPETPNENIFAKVKNALLDYRTWSSIFYFLLMLPLGIIYFTLAVAMMAFSLGLTGGGIRALITGNPAITVSPDVQVDPDYIRLIHEQPWIPDTVAFFNSVGGHVTMVAVGLLLIFLMLHVAKGIGWFHGRIAETLLVRL
jgi:uncharacterized membrane protein